MYDCPYEKDPKLVVPKGETPNMPLIGDLRSNRT